MEDKNITIVRDEEGFAPLIEKWKRAVKDMEVATSKSWKNLPMSPDHYVIQTDIPVPEAAMIRIRMGHIPGQMEDHWFMFCEDNVIRYFRSWTGYNIYNGYVEKWADGCHITKVVVDMENYNTNPSRAVQDLERFLKLLESETR